MSEMFNCPNDTKHFKSGGVVILLSLCSSSTGKCNRTLTTMGIDLGENSTESMDRGIGVQDERFVEIRILQVCNKDVVRMDVRSVSKAFWCSVVQ